MNYNDIPNFVRFCKDKIIDELQNYAGNEYYACDLGYTLTEDINADGSFTYSRELAKEYIKEWWDDASDYWEYEQMSFGEHTHNPFDNPEAYLVCMVVEGVSHILSQCEIIDKAWNDKIKLTKKNIKTITEQVEEIDEYDSLF